MRPWDIEPAPEFVKQLRKLDPQVARRITRTLNEIAQSGQPRSRGKALTGPLGEFWRYRVGAWRVLCELHDDRMVILAVHLGNRDSVYENH